MFDSITQDNRLAISRFYCFWFVRTVLKNVKKFSRIVCVSLFSYQGFFVLSLRQLVYFISSLFVCQVLFSSFFKHFWVKILLSFRWRLGYFIISSVFCQLLFYFFWNMISLSFSQKQFVSNNSDRIASFLFSVNMFFTEFYIFFKKRVFA